MKTLKAKQELEKKFNKIVGTSATNLCTHCGWCIESCHVYLATKDPHVSPAAKAERIRKVYKKSHDWLSKLPKKLTATQLKIGSEIIKELKNRLDFLINIGSIFILKLHM